MESLIYSIRKIKDNYNNTMIDKLSYYLPEEICLEIFIKLIDLYIQDKNIKHLMINKKCNDTMIKKYYYLFNDKKIILKNDDLVKDIKILVKIINKTLINEYHIEKLKIIKVNKTPIIIQISNERNDYFLLEFIKWDKGSDKRYNGYDYIIDNNNINIENILNHKIINGQEYDKIRVYGEPYYYKRYFSLGYKDKMIRLNLEDENNTYIDIFCDF
jgi:hypothetical protein